MLFLYTPANAGSLIEALEDRRPMDDAERTRFFASHGWEVVGPNPLEESELRPANRELPICWRATPINR